MINTGDVVWIVTDYGISSAIVHGEVVDKKPDGEISVVLFPNKESKQFYIHQKNLVFTKNKKDARLIHLAKLCNKADLKYDLEDIYKSLKNKLGLLDLESLKKEIELSQTQFPEMWI